MKVAVLSSYVLDPVLKRAGELIAQAGLPAEFLVAPFGQWRQELIDAQSATRRGNVDAVLVLLDWEDMLAGETFDIISGACQAIKPAKVIVANCVPLRPAPLRLLEWNSPGSVQLGACRLNCELSSLALATDNLSILDLSSLVSRWGLAQLVDWRFYYLAAMPFSRAGIEAVADCIALHLRALKGERRKCLILDLDNTLWGGVLGEDGPERIKLAPSGEGAAWRDFQRSLLALRDSGVLLAICSKNDESEALAVIDSHPYMLLRREHFSSWRINWLAKVDNIASIASELNIGLDSLVFLDDCQFERESVRAVLPPVAVPDPPGDASRLCDFIGHLPYFETLAVTEEDRARAAMYAQERERRELAGRSPNMEDFLRSLAVRVRMEEATQFNLPRIAQLVARTNQFNLTGRRYSESELRELADKPGWSVCALSARDRLGSSGLVAVAIWQSENGTARLDTFLVSCRVLGRGIERAFLSLVKQRAYSQGNRVMIAEYIAGARNSAASGFLEGNRFDARAGALTAELLPQEPVPEWIEVDDG